MEKKIHQGKNVARFRLLLGMKQDALAYFMGDDWTQIKISRLEAKEEIEPAILEEVAKVLKVPIEAITNFDEEAVYNIIGNTVTNNNNNDNVAFFQYNPIINSTEKWMEALEENKNLYISLLKEKDEKIALLQKILQEKNSY